METKPLNRIKADKLALEEKTIQAIEHLTDKEIAEFLHRKWIVPVCQGINGSLTAVLSAPRNRCPCPQPEICRQLSAD